MFTTDQPRTRALLVGAVVLAVLGAAAVVPAAGTVAAADPEPIPASYYGQVTVDGDPVGSGVLVQATVNGEVRDGIRTEANGTFGGPGIGEEKLTVNASASADGEAEVVFLVNGTPTNTTVVWKSGDVQEIRLDVDDVAGGDGSGEEDTGDGDDPADSDDPPDGADPDDPEGPADTEDGEDVAAGSGGGGGGGADEPVADVRTTHFEDQVTVSFDDVPIGAEMHADLGETVSGVGVAFEALEVAMAFDDPGFRIEVAEPTAEPTTAPPVPQGEAVAYLHATPYGVDSTRMDEVRFRFSVADEALPADADPDDVSLYRYSDGSWAELETRHAGNDTYVATSPGFSEFAVVVDSDTEVADETTTATESPSSGGTSTATSTETGTESSTPTATEDRIPGFGLLSGALAALLAALLARRQ